MNQYRGLVLLGFEYFLIVILPYIIFGFKFIWGIISYPDLIDLVLYPPVIGLTLYYIWRKIDVKDVVIDFIYILLLIIHFLGHGFHWASNALDVTIENVGGVPEKVSSYAYFLDEILSHKIMYYSLISIFILIAYYSNKEGDSIDKKSLYIGEFSAIIFGFSITISFIEGQSPYEAIAFGIVLILLILLKARSFEKIYENSTWRYFFHMASWILVWAAAYYILFQGFPQPSEWMQGIKVS